jgi:hypothetical protein
MSHEPKTDSFASSERNGTYQIGIIFSFGEMDGPVQDSVEKGDPHEWSPEEVATCLRSWELVDVISLLWSKCCSMVCHLYTCVNVRNPPV